jgi:hypothetical protein
MTGRVEGKVASDEAQYVTGLEFTVDAGNTIR